MTRKVLNTKKPCSFHRVIHKRRLRGVQPGHNRNLL